MHPAAPDVTVTVGVDTHKDPYVAAAIDALGRRRAELGVPADAAGYKQLHRLAHEQGQVDAFRVEGTGSYGAGLARHLRRAGIRVIEVNRPDRATRHRRGKPTRSTRSRRPGRARRHRYRHLSRPEFSEGSKLPPLSATPEN